MNVVLAFPSGFVNQTLLRTIKSIDAKAKLTSEQGFVVCESSDIVMLASKLEIFGIRKIAIARKVRNEFEELSNAIAEIGIKLILPGEKFFVSVKSGETKDYVSRDLEFVSSGKLTTGLAKKGSSPAKSEQEANRIIMVFVGRNHAYVCIQVSNGLGGLPFGSLGRACCSLYSPLSFQSCYAIAKTGFVTDVILLYSNEEELQANAKFAEILSKRIGKRAQVIRTAPIVLPTIKDTAIAALVKEAIAAKVLISQPDCRVALPFTPAIHPLWFIEKMVGEAVLAEKMPYLPLMFSDLPADYSTAAAKKGSAISMNNFQEYNSVIEAATKLSIKKMKRLQIGPNYLHDILNSI